MIIFRVKSNIFSLTIRFTGGIVWSTFQLLRTSHFNSDRTLMQRTNQKLKVHLIIYIYMCVFISGILQARILEWVAISFSTGSLGPRDWTSISWVSWMDRQIIYHWAMWETDYSFFESLMPFDEIWPLSLPPKSPKLKGSISLYMDSNIYLSTKVSALQNWK